MTAAATRRAHLLELANETEREAEHHFSEQNYDKGERLKKLGHRSAASRLPQGRIHRSRQVGDRDRMQRRR